MVDLPVRQCEFCGKEFTPKTRTNRFCPGPHYRTCVVCGKKFEVDVYQPSLSCSKACSRGLIDYEDRQRKHDATVMERYGVKNVSQVAEVKAKKA